MITRALFVLVAELNAARGNTTSRSESREQIAVKNYLMALGIDPYRIQTISYGKERPEALGHDEAAWAQNRRTVTALSGS